jgi:predicted aspartyl protease
MNAKEAAMNRNGKHDMGRFAVPIEIANYDDMVAAEQGHLDEGKVRRTTIQAVVDSGAARLVLPDTVVKQLGLAVRKQKVKVRYADGRRGIRKEVGPVNLRLLGREGFFVAIAEPKRETALLGAIVLEDLDFLVDCQKQQLVPRDPDYVVSEIE